MSTRAPSSGTVEIPAGGSLELGAGGSIRIEGGSSFGAGIGGSIVLGGDPVDRAAPQVRLEADGAVRFVGRGGGTLARLTADGRCETGEGYAPERCAVLFWALGPLAAQSLHHLRGAVVVHMARAGLPDFPNVPAVRLDPSGEATFEHDYAPDATSRDLWSMIARLNPWRT
jgi:hypothetical protein